MAIVSRIAIGVVGASTRESACLAARARSALRHCAKAVLHVVGACRARVLVLVGRSSGAVVTRWAANGGRRGAVTTTAEVTCGAVASGCSESSDLAVLASGTLGAVLDVCEPSLVAVRTSGAGVGVRCTEGAVVSTRTDVAGYVAIGRVRHLRSGEAVVAFIAVCVVVAGARESAGLATGAGSTLIFTRKTTVDVVGSDGAWVLVLVGSARWAVVPLWALAGHGEVTDAALVVNHAVVPFRARIAAGIASVRCRGPGRARSW